MGWMSVWRLGRSLRGSRRTGGRPRVCPRDVLPWWSARRRGVRHTDQCDPTSR